MTYWMLENDRGTYAVDWDVVNRLVRSYHRAVLRESCSKEYTTSDSRWFNPFSWSLPDIRSLDVDWDKVNGRLNGVADDAFNRLAEEATRDVRGVYRELDWMVSDTGRRTAAFTDRLGALQTENMSRINSAVESYGAQIEAAKFVRDTAADGLMVGASIATGGAGLAILGGGSAMKGWAKYQDTDNAGAAVMTGVGSFTFGAFKLGGAKLTGTEEAVVTILQAQWETGVALAEGKSLGKALATGSLKLSGPFVDRFFKLGPVKTMLERACVPIAITVTTAGGVENIASTVAAKWLAKSVQKQVVERGGKAVINSLGRPTAPAGGASTSQVYRSEVIERATLTDQRLLTLAIVNMSKGIGRGL
jgi:hypothetical protein